MINRFTSSLLTLILIPVLLVISPLVSAKSDKSKPSEVQDLRYGVVLYHFFQQSYFNALTETLVGEQREDLPYHSDAATLLRGGMSLSYGMGSEAESIFNQLLTTLDKQSQRDRAWFYLAKLYYSRGEKIHAGDVLSNIEGPLPETQQQEVTYMLASVALLEGNVTEADQIISGLDETSPWLAYYWFNRGANQTVAGDWREGVQSFLKINDIELNDEEGLSLKDRAFIAAGFAFLSNGEYTQAIDNFLAVRLDSPLVEKAMLGYGWAAAQQEDYTMALSPWQALSERSVMDASVQESLLAIPYAYEKLDAKASSLDEYLNAIEVYEKELVKLAEAVEVFNELPLIQLVGAGDGLSTDWIMGKDYLPINDQAPYLSHLISRQHFQSAVKELNDLITMQEYLTEAEIRLQALQGVLDFQQQVWQDNLGQTQREVYEERYRQLVAAEQRLQQQKLIANKRGDGSYYLTEQQSEQWQLIERASELITLLSNNNEDVSDEKQQLDLYRGLLTWQLSEQESAQSWELEKQLLVLQESLKEAKTRVESLVKLDANRYDAAFSSRIEALQQRLTTQRSLLQQSFDQSEKSIRGLAIGELNHQQQRLKFYLAQAKLAVARLYDVGSEEALQ